MSLVVTILSLWLAYGLPVGSQFVSNGVNCQWLAEVVSLNLVTMMSPKERHLRFVFDALGDHFEV